VVQKSSKSTGMLQMEKTSWHNVAAKQKDRGVDIVEHMHSILTVG